MYIYIYIYVYIYIYIYILSSSEKLPGILQVFHLYVLGQNVTLSVQFLELNAVFSLPSVCEPLVQRLIVRVAAPSSFHRRTVLLYRLGLNARSIAYDSYRS